ncbi:MAG: AraC family transcriptional regulator [Gammaproteobacteria bacterium]|nr:AraC family transcriptional regulator [Gammaproteobacteria bacterium]
MPRRRRASCGSSNPTTATSTRSSAAPPSTSTPSTAPSTSSGSSSIACCSRRRRNRPVSATSDCTSDSSSNPGSSARSATPRSARRPWGPRFGTCRNISPAHQSQTTFTVAERDIVSEHYNDVLWLSYRIFDERFTHKRQDAELSLGMFCNIFRHALGNDWSPLEVCFEHSAPDGADEHTTCFGAPVRFNARTNAIAFRRGDLDTPMPQADPYLYSIVESFLKSRCHVEPSPEDVAAVIRDTIKLNLNERTPTATEVARIMGLTGYGLRKLLRSHGLSFRDLLRAARQDLALKYMADPEVSLTDIALVLGYSELSAFSRAFHAWTGMSPQRYRSAIASNAARRR